MEGLDNYQQLETDIFAIDWKIRKLNLELKRWQPGGDLHDQYAAEHSEKQINRLVEEITQSEKLLREKEKAHEDLVQLINSFEGLDKAILQMRYVEGKSLVSIAAELNYNRNYIYNRQADIKRMIQYTKKQSR